MKRDEILVAVKITPVKVDGVQYCRYKSKACSWYYSYDMCRYDAYSCDLFGGVEGDDKKGDRDIRPRVCVDATVVCKQSEESNEKR